MKKYVLIGLANGVVNFLLLFLPAYIYLSTSNSELIILALTVLAVILVIYLDKSSNIKQKIAGTLIYLFIAAIVPILGFILVLVKWQW